MKQAPQTGAGRARGWVQVAVSDYRNSFVLHTAIVLVSSSKKLLGILRQYHPYLIRSPRVSSGDRSVISAPSLFPCVSAEQQDLSASLCCSVRTKILVVLISIYTGSNDAVDPPRHPVCSRNTAICLLLTRSASIALFPQISPPTDPVMQSEPNQPNEDAEIVSQVGKVAVIMINFDAWQVSTFKNGFVSER